MARPKTVWGIDIGQCALKALKLRDLEGILQVEAFDVIEHPMILSQPEADKEQIIRDALQRFLTKADLAGCHVVVSVPGQSSFSRFVKLPPVESRRVPDIVRFEAEQQIPFPINEVIWRWQTFRDPDSPDVEVGLFAMKRSDVADMLHHFTEADINVDTVQTAPLALYNFMTYDEQIAEDGATLLADVGADKTDLVVADRGRIWTRTIQIGGNSFTEALVRTFKLSFEKAEKLKRSAASSKYARQIFQSMRPVFADLVQEIQRSVGYYTSLHRETRFTKVIGLGNGFRLPGLQKFVEQNLNVPVARLDSYNRVAPSSSASAPAVNEHVLSFAVAYGLALQGLELSTVSTNLLPEEILRKRRWNRKRPLFVAAAVVLLAALFCPGYRASLDGKTLAGTGELVSARQVVTELDRRIKEYKAVKDEGGTEEKGIRELARLFAYREYWPSLVTLVNQSVSAVAQDQGRLLGYARYTAAKELHPKSLARIVAGRSEKLPAKELGAVASVLLDDDGLASFGKHFKNPTPQGLGALAKTLLADTGTDANSLSGLAGEALTRQVQCLFLLREVKRAEAFKAIPQEKWKVLLVEAVAPTYVPNLRMAQEAVGGKLPLQSVAAGGRGKAGYKIEMVAWTSLPRDEANKMVSALYAYSVAASKWYSSISVESHSREWLPTTEAGAAGRPSVAGAAAQTPGPILRMAQGTRFKITWWVAVRGEGIVLANVRPGAEYKLSKNLDLMPTFAPQDPVAAAEKILALKPGTILAIGQDVRTRGTIPWYAAEATDAAGKKLGSGYVSGAALDEQKLDEVGAGATP